MGQRIHAGQQGQENPSYTQPYCRITHWPPEKLWDFWSELAASADPSVIVVIGPNHENAGDGQVQTTHGVWSSPFGSVGTDDELVERLVALRAASDEPGSFVNEHAIGTHIPYLTRLFPGTPMIPMIAKSTADADAAAAFVSDLEAVLPADALMVASVDFSHYLPKVVTAQKDEETIGHADARRFREIERLGSDHLDSPFALITYLDWSDRHGDETNFVWHGFSHDILGDPYAPGTSYLVYFSTLPVPDQPLTLSAVGDIMLGRAVGDKLTRVSVEQAFGAARDVLSGSDLLFGNLESVLSSTTVESAAGIPLKADPTRVGALSFMGFTHLSVSNNHTGDFGKAAWEESLAYLEGAGIVPVGGYRNDGEAVVAEAAGKRVVFLAFETLIHPRSVEEVTQAVQEAATQGEIVVVSVHWGQEYMHEASVAQKKWAYAVVDAGADVVLGHHPHVLQGIERYGEGLILYSLGNFIFDQLGEDQNTSVVARMTLGEDERTLELLPIRIEGFFPREATEAEKIVSLTSLGAWSEASLADDLLDGTLVW
jgi:poly-gamma-glutamate synthesis protein (capsule biosynthesis protein)